MSKVISFSISDRYLDKLRSLYPSLTDNLAAKQFLTDRLDSSLGSGLDASLDDGLDDRVTTLIESWVDGLLDERLDAVMGKSLTSLSERLSRLEERLDDSLDGSLDDMEPLLKREREASITSLIPTGEPSPLPIIEETSPLPIIEETVEATIDKVEAVYTVESVDETDSTDKPGTDAIGPVPGDSPQLNNQLSKAVTIGNRQGLTNQQLSEKTRVPVSTIEKWKKKIKEGEKVTPKKYPDFFKQWTLNLDDSLWYEVD